MKKERKPGRKQMACTLKEKKCVQTLLGKHVKKSKLKRLIRVDTLHNTQNVTLYLHF